MWPGVSRRYCGTHLCANFKKDIPGKPMGNLFWTCCKAFSEFKFKKAMEEVEKKAGKNAIDWLKKRDFECWARCKYDPTLHAPHTYSVNYRPAPDEQQWPRFDLPKIDPPSFKRGVGRPPSKRRRTEDESASRKRSRVVRCGRCKVFCMSSYVSLIMVIIRLMYYDDTISCLIL